MEQEIKAAFDLGAQCAQYKVGDTFLGAWGEADLKGIHDDMLRAAFTCGYLNNLARPVHTDRDGRIVRIG